MRRVLDKFLPAPQLERFCRQWRIRELAVFGSVLRDDFQTDSDLDLLVTFAADANWEVEDRLTMREELEALTGRRVDLIERRLIEASPNWIRRQEILDHAEAVYVA
jgi:predicted nucleotidyltransferase